MRTFHKIALALMLLALPVTAGCQSITNPTELGCSEEEANECRFLVAAAFIEMSNNTVAEAVTARTITVDEARRLQAIIVRGEDALKLAKEALPLEDATTLQRLQALNTVVLQLLREQVVKAGAR